MKITDPQIILNGEKDLISSVQRDLDLDAVRDLLKERLTANVLSPKGGRIVVHDNDVAFRLDYEINLNASLLFDRNGNLLEENERTAPKLDPKEEEDSHESNLDDNLSINLPDYDDVADVADTPHGQTQPLDLEPETLSDDIQDGEPELEIEDPENNSAFDQDDSDSIEAEDGDELTQIGPEDGDRETGEDVENDDISDLLQENRNFWENKKEE